MRLRQRFARAMLGVLRFALPGRVPALPPMGLNDPSALPPAIRRRKRTARQPVTITQWLQSDVEFAQHQAGTGNLQHAARLVRSLMRDGLIIGLLGALTGGLVRLPKTFKGDVAAVEYLQGVEGGVSGFERHFPASELASYGKDIRVLGLAIGELLETDWGPVFCRLDPEFLRYRWWEDRWYYQSAIGEELVTPGDGRWVLHVSTRLEPWANGIWAALARAYISKEHAFFYRENFNAHLAHAARVAITPPGATYAQRKGFLQELIDWGVNSAFELPPGYDIKVMESGGKGYESFRETTTDANNEIMIAIAGQVVTVTGGTGFANADIHATIRQDIIDVLGQALGETISQQALPFVLSGRVANTNCSVEWDTRKAANRTEEAGAFSAAAAAITALVTALKAAGLQVDVLELAKRFRIPLIEAQQIVAAASEPLELEDETAANDEPLEAAMAPEDRSYLNEDAEALALEMTEHGVTHCDHGRANRCDICGVERGARGLVKNDDGTPALDENGRNLWRIEWRAIGASRAA